MTPGTGASAADGTPTQAFPQPAVGSSAPAAGSPPTSGPPPTASVPPPPAGTSRPTAPVTARGLLPATLGGGRYRVTGQLGVGGMGVVVRACDELLGRDVAVKLLADNLALDDGSRARFLHEARAAAAITDPRVVGVYDVGEEEGRPYLVMECVDGPSLAEVLASDGPLAAGEVQRIAVDALGALDRAHEAALLHRDVKPGNLLRAPDGTTKVTDFGVAVAVDGERLTRTGFVIGTAGYLAPERRRGEPATVRTDLWALGATLTELLTGAPPGDEATQRLADRDDLSGPLRELLRRLLAEHPDDRPADALAALALLAEDPVRSGAPTPPPENVRTSVLPAAPTSASSVDEAPASRTGAQNGTVDDPDDPVGTIGTTGTTSPAPTRRRVVRVTALVALVAAGLVATAVLAGSQPGGGADPEFGTVVVDPEDPAGTARELADRLRRHAEE